MSASASPPQQPDADFSVQPQSIDKNTANRQRIRLLFNKIKKITDILLIGSPEAAFLEDQQRWKLKNNQPSTHDNDHNHYASSSGKQLSSIEVDPDIEHEYGDPNRAPTTTKCVVRRPIENATRSNCLTMKRYAFLIVSAELIGLLYLIVTSLIIYTRGVMQAWFFQPFLAPLWLRHPTAIFVAICTFCSLGFVAILCLVRALENGDDNDNSSAATWRLWPPPSSPKLMVPHLVLQMLTIVAAMIFSLYSVVLLFVQGTFGFRVLDLAGSSLGNGVVGIGSIVFGLEHGRISTTATERVLASAGLPILTADQQKLNITNSSDNFTPPVVVGESNSVVHYNMIGAIWETVNYEICLSVALIVFATICATEIFAWLLIRQLYAHLLISRAIQRCRGKAPELSANNGNLEIRNRRRYDSTRESAV